MTLNKHTRSSSLAAALALAALAFGGLPIGCLLNPPPAAVAVATPTPTPVPTPSPAEFVDAEDYFSERQAVEKIPLPLQAASEELRLAAVLTVLNDPSAREEFPKSGACFIAIGASDTQLRDPSDALFGAVKIAGLSLKKFTQCVADERSVRDAATGAQGILVKVVRICWTAPNSALVHYGYSTGGVHGCMTMAEAERIGGSWIFTPRKVAIY